MARHPIGEGTLESGIVVLVGIVALMGKLFRNNKCTGGNKRTGGKNLSLLIKTFLNIHTNSFYTIQS